MKWIQWRRDLLGNPLRLKEDRRHTTDQEKEAALTEQLRVLNDIHKQVKAGSKHMMGVLAGILRSLLHWQTDSKNSQRLRSSYNPILLRAAARLDASLAVYFIPDDPSRPAILDKATRHVDFNKLSIHRELDCQVLGDIQQWLETPVATIALDQSESRRILTFKDVISEAANTLGVHIDEDIPLTLDILRGTAIYDTNALLEILMNAAEVTMALGQHLISEGNRRAAERI